MDNMKQNRLFYAKFFRLQKNMRNKMDNNGPLLRN